MFFILPFLLSFAIVVCATPICIKLAYHFKLLDDPVSHIHPAIIHTKPVPRAGGLPIFLGIMIASIVLLPMNQVFLSILIAGMLVVLVGLLDDKYDLSPYIRFGANILCAAIVVLVGVNVPFITSPFGGIFTIPPLTVAGFSFSVASVLAIAWIVWVMNMLNWSKGVDGQMPGVAAISAIIIGIAVLRFPTLTIHSLQVSQMAFIVAGAAVGFLVFNFYPAKIFPGYSATILGFSIGILSILSGVKLATAILVMGVPTVDAVITILRRTLARKSPFWHDKGHLHHLLLSLGLTQRTIALFYWTMSLLLGVLSLTLSSRGKLFAIILVIVIVGGFILTLRYVLGIKNQK